MGTRRIALTVGDPAGIGPETVLSLLAGDAFAAGVELVVLGPECLRPPAVPALASVAWRGRDRDFDVELGAARAALERAELPRATWIATPAEGTWEVGRAQASAGRAALGALRAGAELAAAGAVAALVTAPVSKEALNLAGARTEGQTQLLATWACAAHVDMLAVAGRMRVSLLTRHMPLRAALAALRHDDVVDALHRLDAGLRGLGIGRPHLALAGLNPHAGESGLLGSEEEELLAPAVERVRAQGLRVDGPEPPDTVFLRAFEGCFDGVLALYHDQAFIPVKLAAPMRAITVLLGLPYLRVSPAHGTAFDIAGQGRADPGNLRVALEWALERVACLAQGPASIRERSSPA